MNRGGKTAIVCGARVTLFLQPNHRPLAQLVRQEFARKRLQLPGLLFENRGSGGADLSSGVLTDSAIGFMQVHLTRTAPSSP